MKGTVMRTNHYAEVPIDGKVRLAIDWNMRIRNLREINERLNYGKFKDLTEAVNAARTVIRHQAEAWEHLDDFGLGHECEGLLDKTCKREWKQFEKDLGMSFDELYALTAARTTNRWAHFNLNI